MTNKLFAHLLIDRSGSMASVRQRTVDAVNEYISGLRADTSLDAMISVSLFDYHAGRTDITEVVAGRPASEARLDEGVYVPRGMTPLNDAIGRTVARMRADWHRPDERLALVILTDGLENKSTEYSTEAVRALLEDVRREGWLVIYLGANQDAFEEGGARGVVTGQSLSFNVKSVDATMRAAMRSTRSYAAGADWATVSFSDQERAEAAKP